MAKSIFFLIFLVASLVGAVFSIAITSTTTVATPAYAQQDGGGGGM